MKFGWDEEMRLANVVKHGVDFTDACRLFEGPFMTMTDTAAITEKSESSPSGS